MEGWVKLHRSCLEHWLYTEYRPLTRREAWETMLFTVNYESKKVLIKGQLIDCDRGQSLLSLESWAEKFVWSIQQVRTFFKLLEADNMIITEGLQYTTRLTICNYDKYQDNQQTANTPLTDGQQTANTPLTTTKESKEGKEIKEYNNADQKPEEKKPKRKQKEFIPPTLEEMKQYFILEGYKPEIAEKAYRHYKAGDWHDSKGNKVKNWKQKVTNNWFKDEYKMPKEQPKKQVNKDDLFGGRAA